MLNSSHESMPYSALPPASNHPSLSVSLPPPSSHPSLALAVKARELPSLTIPARTFAQAETSPSSRRSTPRRSSTPYHAAASTTLSRPRRTRPEPFQLEELKKLNARTSNPSIEERTALALEIGMWVFFQLLQLTTTQMQPPLHYCHHLPSCPRTTYHHPKTPHTQINVCTQLGASSS